MAWAKVGAFGAVGTSTINVTPAFGQATTAGNTLIAAVAADGTTITCTSSGWVVAVGSSGAAAVWYKPNCGAGETAPTFGGGNGIYIAAVLSEWSGGGASPTVDQTGTTTSTASPVAIAASGNDTDSSDLAISAYRLIGSKSHTLTVGSAWTPASGTASNMGNDGSTKQVDHGYFDSYLLNTHGGGAADTDTLTLTLSTGVISSAGGAIASFKVTAAAGLAPPPLIVKQAVQRAAVR